MKKDPISPSKIFAIIISLIFNPALVILFTLFIGNLELIREDLAISFMYFFLIFTAPFVLYIYFILVKKKNIFLLPEVERRERNILYLVHILSIIGTILLFSLTLQNPNWIYNGMILSIFFSIYFLINRYIDKISFHSGAIALASLYLIDNNSVFFVIGFFILPIVMWARVKLHKHTWFQLLLGIGVSMFIGLMTWLF